MSRYLDQMTAKWSCRVFATCYYLSNHTKEGVSCCALPNDATSKLSGLFSTLSF